MVVRDPPAERSVSELLTFGVVNLDKPPGPSAHQVAAWVREMAGVDRVAHAGTLDPKVTGCLPLLLGDATRMAQVFDDSRKEYIAVLECHRSPPADFREIVAEFEGRLYQKPPRKSAVRRDLRIREVYDLDVLEVDGRQALLDIYCESGTYIRKLCHDIGLALGTGAHMGHLRRIATEPFDDTGLVTLEDLSDAISWWEEADDETPIRDVVQPAERALVDLPRATIAPSAAREVAEGAPVYAPGVIDFEDNGNDNGNNDGDSDTTQPLVACYTPDGTAVCLGRLVGDPDAQHGTVVSLERVLV